MERIRKNNTKQYLFKFGMPFEIGQVELEGIANVFFRHFFSHFLEAAIEKVHAVRKDTKGCHQHFHLVLVTRG